MFIAFGKIHDLNAIIVRIENVRFIEVTRFNSNSIYASFVHHSFTRASCFMHSAALCVVAVDAAVAAVAAADAAAAMNDSHFIRCHENM